MEARKQQVIGEILAGAKEAKTQGKNTFDYCFKKLERDTFLRNITTEVNQATGGNVKPAYRGDHWTHVKFIVL